MKELELILKRENNIYASIQMYIILGHLGDKLNPECEKYIRDLAEELTKNAEIINKKLRK